jgi:hypothetical protein
MDMKVSEDQSVTLQIAGAELTISAATITSMLLERLQTGAARPLPAPAATVSLPAIGSKSADGKLIYAGIARGMESEHDYHLWLVVEKPDRDMPWADAMKWAEQLGDNASLPKRHEQALLYANLKDQFDAAWYWSCEQYAGNDAYAWDQDFYGGSQSYGHETSNFRVRAVRRFPIQ